MTDIVQTVFVNVFSNIQIKDNDNPDVQGLNATRNIYAVLFPYD